MKRIADIPEEIAGRLDLPAETVAGVPKLTVTGRRRALIENHRGLLQYSRDCIEVDGGRVRPRREFAARGDGPVGSADLRRDPLRRV